MKVEFLFDFISPYAYLAFKQLPALQAETGAQVEPVPLLFAGLLNAHGNVGPAEVPAKRLHVMRDVLRKAQLASIPMAVPPAHPFNPLLPLRIVTSIEDPAMRWRAAGLLFDALWKEGTAIDTAQGCQAALATEDAAALIEGAATDEAKRRLREATDEAVEAGVFGVPTFLLEGQLFWGVDSLPLVKQYLRDGDQFDADLIARWDALPAAAHRKR